MFTSTPEGLYRSSVLSELPWVEHGFASRQLPSWPGAYTSVKQVHSSVVVVADGRSSCVEGSFCVEEGDALVTSDVQRWIGIRTADCVPILLADANRRVVAAVHAGWRGTSDKIITRVVETLTAAYGCNPANLVAAIGPCIEERCYEVGAEVSLRFRSQFPDRENLTHVDLPEGNRRQLIAAGVQGEKIDVSGLCTRCEAPAFHSYRRDREQSGRMVSAIRLRP